MGLHTLPLISLFTSIVCTAVYALSDHIEALSGIMQGKHETTSMPSTAAMAMPHNCALATSQIRRGACAGCC